MKDIMLLPRNHHHLHLSTCLSGGGGGAKTAYAVELSTSSSSSAASTLSTSSSSPCSVAATRKPRTPRKRPNQTYNEAAAILSASYPNLFHSPKCHAGSAIPFFLLPRAAADDHLLFSPPPTTTRCLLPRADHSPDFSRAAAVTDPDSDFDAESLLDDDSSADAGRGIDTIMGDLAAASANDGDDSEISPPLGLGLGFASALRRDFFRGESANWWCFPAVDMLELSPRLNRNPPPPLPAAAPTKQKKMKKAKPAKVDSAAEEEICGGGGLGLSLNLNYEGVMRAWSGKGSAFSGEGRLNDDDDVAARAAEIELFPGERGGVREASVLRYKEKRRTRLFSKKIIRYQVRKVNADRRPRMKGRFVRRPNQKHD